MKGKGKKQNKVSGQMGRAGGSDELADRNIRMAVNLYESYPGRIRRDSGRGSMVV